MRPRARTSLCIGASPKETETQVNELQQGLAAKEKDLTQKNKQAALCGSDGAARELDRRQFCVCQQVGALVLIALSAAYNNYTCVTFGDRLGHVFAFGYWSFPLPRGHGFKEAAAGGKMQLHGWSWSLRARICGTSLKHHRTCVERLMRERHDSSRRGIRIALCSIHISRRRLSDMTCLSSCGPSSHLGSGDAMGCGRATACAAAIPCRSCWRTPDGDADRLGRCSVGFAPFPRSPRPPRLRPTAAAPSLSARRCSVVPDVAMKRVFCVLGSSLPPRRCLVPRRCAGQHRKARSETLPPSSSADRSMPPSWAFTIAGFALGACPSKVWLSVVRPSAGHRPCRRRCGAPSAAS